MARALGYRIRETGIAWTDREGSRVLDGPRVLVPVVRELLAARRHVRRAARTPRAGGRPPPSAAEPR